MGETTTMSLVSSVLRNVAKHLGRREARPVAYPHPPPNVPVEQAPGRLLPWSRNQRPRLEAMRGPRFEQTSMDFQPMPLPAIELIKEEPIRVSDTRVAHCDGGDGPLGHPRIFINLEKDGPRPCSYCGLQFEYH